MPLLKDNYSDGPSLCCVSMFVADVDTAPELTVGDKVMQSPPEAGAPEQYEIIWI